MHINGHTEHRGQQAVAPWPTSDYEYVMKLLDNIQLSNKRRHYGYRCKLLTSWYIHVPFLQQEILDEI